MNIFEQIYVFGSIALSVFLLIFYIYKIVDDKNILENKKEKYYYYDLKYSTPFVKVIVNDLLPIKHGILNFIGLTREESFLFLKELDNFIIEKNNLAAFTGCPDLTKDECQEILDLQRDFCSFSKKSCIFLSGNSYTSIDLLNEDFEKIKDTSFLLNLNLTLTAKKLLAEKLNKQVTELITNKITPIIEIKDENLDNLINLELEKYEYSEHNI